MSETIFAPLTLKGNCSIYVVRISGSKVKDCLYAFGIKELEHRNATLCKLKYADEILDEALVIYFKAPNSFTGEDVCELNLHCSSYIIKKVFEILASVEGVRFADRGEFSKRAFLNGKIDLMQAESILDLINSETELQHKQAINQLQGKNSKFYNTLREQVVKVLSLLEAYIDFPDEHLPEENLKKQVEEITAIVDKNLSDEKVGERIRDGFKIAIIGEPNVGKSTLLNYLAKRDVAIVSDIAGTTRDIIEVHLDINGIPVILYDTAGIRETTDKIEKEGVKRAIEQAEKADLKILLLSSDNMNPNAEIMKLVNEKTIIVVNKCDLVKDEINIKSEFDYIDYKDLSKQVRKYYQKNIQGKSIFRDDIGEVKFSRKGIDKTISNGCIDTLLLIPHIQNIIKDSDFLDNRDTYKFRNDKFVSFIGLKNKIIFNNQRANILVLLGKTNTEQYYYINYIINKEELADRHLRTKSKSSATDTDLQNKSKLYPISSTIINDNFKNVNKILISLKDNTNIDIFIKRLQDELEKIISPNIDTTITNERYRNELKQALFYLKVFDIKEPLEICAENMRIVAKHIGNITGKIGVEELLDNIFSKFCIGK